MAVSEEQEESEEESESDDEVVKECEGCHESGTSLCDSCAQSRCKDCGCLLKALDFQFCDPCADGKRKRETPKRFWFEKKQKTMLDFK